MTTCIDNEERLHLALRASFDGDHHTAILHLKELLKDEPEHAEALYLLAIQHAELGLFDREQNRGHSCDATQLRSQMMDVEMDASVTFDERT